MAWLIGVFVCVVIIIAFIHYMHVTESHSKHVVSIVRERKGSPDKYKKNCAQPLHPSFSRTVRPDNTCFNASSPKLDYFKVGLDLLPKGSKRELSIQSSNKKIQSKTERNTLENLTSPCAYEMKPTLFQNHNFNNSQMIETNKEKKPVVETSTKMDDKNSDGSENSKIINGIAGKYYTFSENFVDGNKSVINNSFETPDVMDCSAETSSTVHDFDDDNNQATFNNCVQREVFFINKRKIQSQTGSSSFENLSLPCAYERKPSHFENNNLNNSQKFERKRKQTEVENAIEMKHILTDGSVNSGTFNIAGQRQNTFSEVVVNENAINVSETLDEMVCGVETSRRGVVHESDNRNQETLHNCVPRVVSSKRKRKIQTLLESSSFEHLSLPYDHMKKPSQFENNNLHKSLMYRKKKKKQTEVENALEMEHIVPDGSVSSGTFGSLGSRQNSFSEDILNGNKNVQINSYETRDELVYCAKSTSRDAFNVSDDNEAFNHSLNSNEYSFGSELLVDPFQLLSRKSKLHVETTYDKSLSDALETTHNKNSKALSSKDMHVILNHEIPELHMAHVRPCCIPNTEEKHKLLKLGMKQVPFSKSEDTILMANWDSFCEVHDVKDPSEFLDMRKLRNIKFKREFLQFLGNGLPHRALYQIYQRFRLLKPLKKGKFTKEEDCIILKVMHQNVTKPFSKLSRVLNRTRHSVYKRSKMLDANISDRKESELERRKWDKAFAENVIKSLMKITKVSSLKELRNGLITAEQWRNVEADIKVPNWKLRQFWNYKLHVQLFAKKTISTGQIFVKIIKWLHQLKPPDEKHIPWQESINLFEGSTQWFMWEMFRRLKKSNERHLHMPLTNFIKLMYENKQEIYKVASFLPRYKVNEDLSLSVVEEDSLKQNHNFLH